MEHYRNLRSFKRFPIQCVSDEELTKLFRKFFPSPSISVYLFSISPCPSNPSIYLFIYLICLIFQISSELFLSSDPIWLEWELEFQYSSNFNYTLNDFYCLDESSYSLSDADFSPLAWAYAPNVSDAKIELLPESSLSWIPDSLPFQLLLWNRLAYQIVCFTFKNSQKIGKESSQLLYTDSYFLGYSYWSQPKYSVHQREN